MQAETERDLESTYVTNAVSWIHNIPWGANLEVKNIVEFADVKKRLHGKRVEFYAWPDTELMGKLAMYGILPPPMFQPKTPREAAESMQDSFFTWMKSHMMSTLGRSIRELQRPYALEVGKQILLAQIVMVEGESALATARIPQMKTFWYEITPIRVDAKPEGLVK